MGGCPRWCGSWADRHAAVSAGAGGDLRTTDSGHGPIAVPCCFARALERLPFVSVIDGLSLSTGIVSAPGLWRSGRAQPPRERP
jgi:hypothetical protein